jgi:CBS-domain-containing membrane protein
MQLEQTNYIKKKKKRKTKYILYKETLVDFKEHFWAFIGSFTGIGVIAYLQSQTLDSDVVYLIGSFGASCVLIYGVQSPLGNPVISLRSCYFSNCGSNSSAISTRYYVVNSSSVFLYP